MRYRLAPLALLLLCGGCFPKKSPEGEWTTTLWNLPMKIEFKAGKIAAHGDFNGGHMSAIGDYTYDDKDGGSGFQFEITDIQVKHGNPYTQQMLNQQIQTVANQKSFKGYLKFEKPNEMDMVVESYGSSSSLEFKKVLP